MDKKRVIAKIDEVDSYKSELKSILPDDFEDYASSTETKRASERLIHLMIESVIDISALIIKELKLGLPSEEEDMFRKLHKKRAISSGMMNKLKRMKGFRNILVHRYSEVDDELVFSFLRNNIRDFDEFRKSIISFIDKH